MTKLEIATSGVRTGGKHLIHENSQPLETLQCLLLYIVYDKLPDMQQLKTFYSFLLLALGLTCFSANGQTWTPMGIPGGTIRAITEYNGEVIVAGTFDLGGGLKGIAKWNAATSSWDSLGSGLPSGEPIYALAVYNGELYVGGDFDLGGSWPGIQRGIRKWDGLSWSSVGTSGVVSSRRRY